MRLNSAGLIRMGTLRGKRGLGSGCYGALENVSKEVEPVALLQNAQRVQRTPDGLSGLGGLRSTMRLSARCA